MKFVSLISALCLVAFASISSAATYNVTGSFSGGQLGLVSFDVDITADFSMNIGATSSGLTINSLTSDTIGGAFVPSGGLVYRYDFNVGLIQDRLALGGAAFGISSISAGDNDFLLIIDNFKTAPSARVSFDTWEGLPTSSGRPNAAMASVALVPTVVPLPAGLPLLLSGLALVAVTTRHRRIAT